MTPHSLELASLILSCLAAACSWALFTLKLADLIQAKDARANGPLLFMVKDNIRRQGITMVICAGMVALAISGYHNPEPLTAQVRNLLTGMCVFALLMISESVFIYRRRGKLPMIIALHEETLDRRPGGQRKNDPPALEPLNE